MESLGEALDEFVRKQGLQEALDRVQLEEQWDDIVGPPLANHLSVSKLNNGRLWLTASDPSWSHQATMMQEEIRRAINSAFDRELVRSVRVQN